MLEPAQERLGIAVLAARTTQEEANLVARFGDRYRQYMRRTGRLFPRWVGGPT
jgi:protein-S-isoprenylcysteine O-methyltransferase Ste14